MQPDFAKVDAFGLIKTTAEWARDPLCQVEEEVLRRRLLEGWEAEAALTTLDPRPAKHSRFVGVTWEASRNKWRAQIKQEGKVRFLGYYLTQLEAAQAFERAALARGGDAPAPHSAPSKH